MSNDNNADECKRFAGEREAFDEWYPTGCPGAGVTAKLSAQAGFRAGANWQARAAQPAPVVPEGYVLAPAVATPQMKNAGWQEIERQGIDPESCEMQSIYHAMIFAAAPAQGQQVECQECERLRKLSVENIMLDVVPGCDGSGVEVYAQSVDDVISLLSDYVDCQEERDQLRAELAALKAQQVGQEPEGPNYKFKFETLVEHCKRQDQLISELTYDRNIRRFYDDGAVWFWCGDETDNLPTLACPVVINAGDLRALIAPQPAPAQDVADVRKMARALSDRQADACNVDREDQWKVYSEDFVADVEAMLAAAHDKQSGGE